MCINRICHTKFKSDLYFYEYYLYYLQPAFKIGFAVIDYIYTCLSLANSERYLLLREKICLNVSFKVLSY